MQYLAGVLSLTMMCIEHGALPSEHVQMSSISHACSIDSFEPPIPGSGSAQLYRYTTSSRARCPCRHEDLLAWSRSWITRETLEQRIQHALDNPVLLFPGEDELVDSGFPSLSAGDSEDPDGVADRMARSDDVMAADRDEMDEGSDEDQPHRPRTSQDL